MSELEEKLLEALEELVEIVEDCMYYGGDIEDYDSITLDPANDLINKIKKPIK